MRKRLERFLDILCAAMAGVIWGLDPHGAALYAAALIGGVAGALSCFARLEPEVRLYVVDRSARIMAALPNFLAIPLLSAALVYLYSHRPDASDATLVKLHASGVLLAIAFGGSALAQMYDLARHVAAERHRQSAS
jgi:hypothetical protein